MAEKQRAAEFICSEVLRWVYSLTAGSRNRKAAALLALAGTDSPRRIEILERFANSRRSSLANVAKRVLLDVRRPEAQAVETAAKTLASTKGAVHV